MLKIDHIIIFVQDLYAAIEDFRALGFVCNYGGKHADGITENGLIIFADGTYLELIAIVEGHSYDEATFKGLLLENGEGYTGYALVSDDIQTEVKGLQTRGIQSEAIRAGSRKRPDGVEIRWQMTNLDSGRIPFLIQDDTPRLLRVPAEGEHIQHENGAEGIAELKIMLTDLDAELKRYQSILGSETENGRFELGESTILLEEADSQGFELTLKTSKGEQKTFEVRGAKVILN